MRLIYRSRLLPVWDQEVNINKKILDGVIFKVFHARGEERDRKCNVLLTRTPPAKDLVKGTALR